MAEELRTLFAHTIAQAANFASSQVSDAGGHGTSDPNQRRSRVLFELGPFGPPFLERLRFVLPHILFMLGRPHFAVTQLELQLTASNDGDFFRPHRDTGSGATAARELTFVYFFHREPRRFTGGELRIFGEGTDPDHKVAPSVVVEPAQNEIVFFPSHLLHEVLPVYCSSRAFEDSRFTVNGWYRR